MPHDIRDAAMLMPNRPCFYYRQLAVSANGRIENSILRVFQHENSLFRIPTRLFCRQAMNIYRENQLKLDRAWEEGEDPKGKGKASGGQKGKGKTRILRLRFIST